MSIVCCYRRSAPVIRASERYLLHKEGPLHRAPMLVVGVFDGANHAFKGNGASCHFFGAAPIRLVNVSSSRGSMHLSTLGRPQDLGRELVGSELPRGLDQRAEEALGLG
jgi:hypothetical protein